MVTIITSQSLAKTFDDGLTEIEGLYNSNKYKTQIHLSSPEIPHISLPLPDFIELHNNKMQGKFVMLGKGNLPISEIKSNIKQMILNKGDTYHFTLLFKLNLTLRIIMIPK